MVQPRFWRKAVPARTGADTVAHRSLNRNDTIVGQTAHGQKTPAEQDCKGKPAVNAAPETPKGKDTDAGCAMEPARELRAETALTRAKHPQTSSSDGL